GREAGGRAGRASRLRRDAVRSGGHRGARAPPHRHADEPRGARLMVLAWPLLLGLAVAPLLGGRWSRLADLRIRNPGVFYAAFVLQVVAFPFSHLPWSTPDRAAVALWLVSYALLAVGAACNIRLPRIRLVVLGMLSHPPALLAHPLTTPPP